MTRSPSLAAWTSIPEPDSSDGDHRSSEEDDKLSFNIRTKRKRKTHPFARASPKRQRAEDDVDIERVRPRSAYEKLHGITASASAGSSKLTSKHPRVSEPGLPEGMPGPSIHNSRPITSATAPARNTKASDLTGLSKTVGERKGKERMADDHPRSISALGTTRGVPRPSQEVIDLTQGDDLSANVVRGAQRFNNHKSEIHIPNASKGRKHRTSKEKLKKHTRSPDLDNADVISISSDDNPSKASSSQTAPPSSTLKERVSGSTVSKAPASSLLSNARNTSIFEKSSLPRSKLDGNLRSSLAPRKLSAEGVNADSHPNGSALARKSISSNDDSNMMDVDVQPTKPSNNASSLSALSRKITTEDATTARRSNGSAHAHKSIPLGNDSSLPTKSTNTSSFVAPAPPAASSVNNASLTAPLANSKRPTKLPPPARHRSSLSGGIPLPHSSLVSSKGQTNASKPSLPPRRSSGLDMSGLKDVLTDTVDSPVLQANKASGRASISAKAAPYVSRKTPSDLKGKGKAQQQLPPSRPGSAGKAATSNAPKTVHPNAVIDLTLTSDEGSPPPHLPSPLPPRATPLPLPRRRPSQHEPASASSILKTPPVKPEPIASPQSKLPSRGDNTPIRPSSTPLPLPPRTEPKRIATPILVSVFPTFTPRSLPTPTPRVSEKETFVSTPTLAVDDTQPIATPRHSASSQSIMNPADAIEAGDEEAKGDDDQGSGSEHSSTSSSSNRKSPPISLSHRTARKSAGKSIRPTSPHVIVSRRRSRRPVTDPEDANDDGNVQDRDDDQASGSESSSASSSSSSSKEKQISLPHRTARKSGRGRNMRYLPASHSSPRIPTIHHPPATSSPAPTSPAPEAKSAPTSPFQRPVGSSWKPSGFAPNKVLGEGQISDAEATEPMDIVSEAVVAETQTTYAPLALPAASLDDDDELEYVDVPIATPPVLPNELETLNEISEMMDVEESLAPSVRESPLPVPIEQTDEASPGPMNMFDLDIDVEIVPLRRSARSSRSSSENIDYFPEDPFVDTASSPPTSSTPPEDFSLPTPIKFFGGMEALTWRTFRQDPENFRPKCYFSKDLPHTLQDAINSFSEAAKHHRSITSIMQAAIRENTAEDEPEAPLIEIINELDDTPTPPWEFHYSNKMWLGENVPLPDVANLVHCNCVGRCDPKSKTCACVRRQHEWTQFANPDFLYDLKGHIKTTDYPVFECNDQCGCGDECRNRVVQHGRKCAVRIQKTKDKGWGVFAGAKKILAGSFIGIYAGELLTDSEGEKRGVTYDKYGRTYLCDLDFWHLKEGKASWDIQYTVDAYHAGNFTRFVNHSCDPNCSLVSCYINEADIQKPLLTVFARRDIEPFDEICFSYTGYDPEDRENEPRLPRDKDGAVYIKCACGAKNCTGYMFN